MADIFPVLINGVLQYPKVGYITRTLDSRLGGSIYLTTQGEPISIAGGNKYLDYTNGTVACQNTIFKVLGVNPSDSTKLWYEPKEGFNTNCIAEGEQGEAMVGYIYRHIGYNDKAKPFLNGIYVQTERVSYKNLADASNRWTASVWSTSSETEPITDTSPNQYDIITAPSGALTIYNIYDSYSLSFCLNFLTLEGDIKLMRPVSVVSDAIGYGDHATYWPATFRATDNSLIMTKNLPWWTDTCYMLSSTDVDSTMLTCPTDEWLYLHKASEIVGGIMATKNNWTSHKITKRTFGMNWAVYQLNGTWVTDFTIPNHPYISGDIISLYNSGYSGEKTTSYPIKKIDANTVRYIGAFDNSQTVHNGYPSSNCQFIHHVAPRPTIDYKYVSGYIGIINKWT